MRIQSRWRDSVVPPAALLAVLRLLGCHTPDPPRPTLDLGGCWPQPENAEHSAGDECMPDLDAEPNGRLTTADGKPFLAAVPDQYN